MNQYWILLKHKSVLGCLFFHYGNLIQFEVSLIVHFIKTENTWADLICTLI